MKQDHRLTINIITLLIILGVGFGVSNLLTNSFRQESIPHNTQTTISMNNDETKLKTDESEEIIHIYDSEKYVDSIIDDLASSEEEVNFVPKISFIIDDLGYEKEVAQKIKELDLNIRIAEKEINKIKIFDRKLTYVKFQYLII